MNRALLLLILIFGINLSHSQNQCLQADGTYRYEAKLYLENPEFDFDKADFLDYIISVDVISANDLATLTSEITAVYKTFPSPAFHNNVTIVTTSEIYSILDNLNNSIENQYCVGTNCEWTDGTYKYNAVINMEIVPTDFDKNDFIDFITGLDSISIENLSVLETSITSVYSSYPTAQTPSLKKVITIESTSDIFSILGTLNNSFEYYVCDPEPFPLSTTDNSKDRKSFVFPNPITDNSVIKLDADYSNVKIEILNSLGQVIYHESISGETIIELKSAPVVNGIYFLKISDSINGTEEILKLIKH